MAKGEIDIYAAKGNNKKENVCRCKAGAEAEEKEKGSDRKDCSRALSGVADWRRDGSYPSLFAGDPGGKAA